MSGTGEDRRVARRDAWAEALPALVYLPLAVLLIAQRPGLQYEEATFQHGAVHLLTDPHALPSEFNHDPRAWVPLGGVYWPLMIVPYVGAVPFYVFAATFAVFGPSPQAARVVTSLLGGLGVWGLCRLLRKDAGAAATLAFGLALALHPSYLVHTVFNKASVAFWMGSLGVLCLALRSYLARRTTLSAFAVGLAAGVGCWAWLQFASLLAAAALGVVVVLGRRARVPAAHLGSALGGGLLGTAPLLLYQVRSDWATLRALPAYVTRGELGARVLFQLRIFGDTLVCDAEQRLLMWHGPPVPRWQACLMLGLAAAGLAAACCRLRGSVILAWHRILAVCCTALIALLVLGGPWFTPHYFVAVLPLVAATVVLAGARLAQAHRLRLLVALLAAAYAAVSLSWDVTMCRRLAATGGRGDWSDAILPLARHLQTLPEGRDVKVLDWGLANNLYVLSGGRIRPQELFWDATPEGTVGGRTWAEVIVPGAFYLTNAEGHRHFPAATAGFRDALARSGWRVHHLEFRGRDGFPYAELYAVDGAP